MSGGVANLLLEHYFFTTEDSEVKQSNTVFIYCFNYRGNLGKYRGTRFPINTTSMCPYLIYSMWFISKVHLSCTFIHGSLHKKHGMPSL